MSALSKIRGWAHLHLMRLKFKIKMRDARKANQFRTMCCLTLDAEVRYLKRDLLQLGEDDHLDLIVEYVARQLTGRAQLLECQSVAGEDLVFELIDLAQKSADIKIVISRYHAIESYFSGLFYDDAGRSSKFLLAKAILPEITEYTPKTMRQEHRLTVARHLKLRRLLANRSALNFEFSVQGISSSIAVVTAIFVVAGFLYIHYFYSRMGVEVSNYFSAADYLAASVEQIRSGAFAAAMSLLTFTMGVQSGSRRSRLQIELATPKRRRDMWFFAAFTLFLLINCAYRIYVDEPDFTTMRAAGIFLSYWIADYISRELFSNRLAAMSAIVGTMIFGVNVGVAAYERSEHLLKPNDSVVLQKLHFKDTTPLITGELFGANSSYYFVYDRTKNVTHVVPRDRVAQIDISKKEINKDASKSMGITDTLKQVFKLFNNEVQR